MKTLGLIALVTLFGQGLALPPTRRADPGFPSPSQQQLEAIEVQASGKLSNAPPPSKLAQSSLTALQLVAFNELFEVAFFTSLLNNITNNVPGYESKNKDALVKAISAVVAVRVSPSIPKSLYLLLARPFFHIPGVLGPWYDNG